MTTELAVMPDRGTLDPAQVNAVVTRMVEIRQNLELWGEEDAASVYKAASVQREAAKLMPLLKQAHVLAVEASRLEATALRRLGQLKALSQLPSNKERIAARGLTAMTPEEFSAFIAYMESGAMSATDEWREHKFALSVRAEQAVDPEAATTRAASKALVNGVLRSGSRLEASKLVEPLAEWLNVPADLRENPLVRRGLIGSIREAAHGAANNSSPRFSGPARRSGESASCPVRSAT